MNNKLRTITAATIAGLGFMASASAFAGNACKEITYSDFTDAANLAYEETNQYGFGLPMWATLVDKTGKVCFVYSVKGLVSRDNEGNVIPTTGTAVANTGVNSGNNAWLGSRVISAQKASTANAFSLDNLAISSGAITVATYEGGSLFGLQASNPVDATNAYKGPAQRRGKKNDPLVGKTIGGINLFGGGVALYDSSNVKIGGVGASGDTSCRDHTFAWRLRANLGLDNGPNSDALELVDTTSTPLSGLFQQPACGVNDPTTDATIGIIYDPTP